MLASAAAYNVSVSATPFAVHSGDSGSVGMTATSTSRAAAATAAFNDVGPVASASNAYGRERRSMVFTASWTAAWTIAYMRDSARPFPLMCRQAAVAALAAFSFHLITASALTAFGHDTSSNRHSPIILMTLVLHTSSREWPRQSCPRIRRRKYVGLDGFLWFS